MTPYDILNITSTTPFDDIKKAYRRLAQKNHPDKGGNQEVFKRIQNAFEWIEAHHGKDTVENDTFVHSHDDTEDAYEMNDSFCSSYHDMDGDEYCQSF